MARPTKVIFYSGLTILVFSTWAVTFSYLGFIIGVSANAVVASLSLVATFATLYALVRRDWREIVAGMALATLVCIACCLIAGQFYDLSYDGNNYHKSAVVALATGWNPVQESVTSWPYYNDIFLAETRVPLWLDHYPQGIWQLAAIIYSLTGVLEQAKAFTLIAMYASAALLGSFLRKKGLTRWQMTIISILAVVNPITIPQFTTFYCDAFLMMALLQLLIGLVLVADSTEKGELPIALLVVICAFVLCSQTKFSGLAYAGVFTVAFCVLYIVFRVRGKDSFTTKRLTSIAVTLILMLVFSVTLLGMGSYIPNFIDHGNPLYPLYGEGSVDIMTNQAPASFQTRPNIEKVLLAIFSDTENIYRSSGIEPTLKIPLTFSRHELDSLQFYDLRLGGYGVLYSAIFVLTLIGYVVMVMRSRKTHPLLFATAVTYGATMVLLVLLLSDSWWARYSPYTYFSITLVLVYVCSVLPRRQISMPTAHWDAQSVIAAVFGVVLTLLVAANSLLFVAYNTRVVYRQTQDIKAAMQGIQATMAETNDDLKITYLMTEGGIYRVSQIFTLYEWGIPFTLESPDNASAYSPDSYLNGLLFRFDTPGASQQTD